MLDAVSGIRRQGFQDAAQAQGVGQNISQLSNIGSGISNLAGAGQQQAIGRIGAMATQGAAARGIEQADMSRRFRAADKLADEPFNRLQGGPATTSWNACWRCFWGASTGAQIYQPQVFAQPSPLSQAAGLGSMIAGAVGASDVELKENIRRVEGDYDNNLGWYEWDWNDKAKEIGIRSRTYCWILGSRSSRRLEPEAVTIKDGYYAVDYARLMK